jgi:hypothetical protein
MVYLTNNVTSLQQNTMGYMTLYNPLFNGFVNGYYTNIDTRVGKNASDLALAKNIIAGNVKM